MTTLTITIGLPASGKSTWAERQVLDSRPGTVVRLTKDQLRLMLHAGRYDKRNEPQVVAARNALVKMYLSRGVDVIVDDTNFNPHHQEELRKLAYRANAEFVIEDFTHVELDECIRRDRLRPNSVGENVIRGMWSQYLANRTPFVEIDAVDQAAPDETGALEIPAAVEMQNAPTEPLPFAVVVDIDGTLATMGDRSPYDWHRVDIDMPKHQVIAVVRALAQAGNTIVFMSGRDGSCRSLTQAWLDEHVAVPGALHMRAAGDNRKDSTIKRELHDQHIKGVYDVLAVLDDRNQVVDMWREELGLVCLQVAPGDF